MEDLMEKMPKMVMGEGLEEAMLSLPDYDPAICKADAGIRLMALNDIAEIYIPSQMSYEIYSKIYLSMLHSLKKKQTREAVRQGNQNHRRLQGLSYHSVLGGTDSFSITGPSGIGKSTALQKSIALAGGGEIIITQEPYAQIIPCVNVQCPHDCSIKGLLLAVLAQVDIAIGTSYQQMAVKNRASIDNLIGTVSQVALNNILLIVIDECQNVCRNKGGVNLVSAMTQLINSSGVSICMVGLPETELFFQNEMQLARRSVGLSYQALPCNDYFIKFCETLFSYQYVSHPSRITPDLIELLYECTGGILALVVSIIMEAQQIAILTGKEVLNKETILLAYEERLKNVQDFVKPKIRKRKQAASAVKKNSMNMPKKMLSKEPDMGIMISEILSGPDARGMDAVELLAGKGITIEGGGSMISFLPSIYTDELIYSWFCRCFVHSGYPTNKTFLEQLLFNRHCNPSKEFIGHLNPEMEQMIRKIYPMEELVLGHTMFPQYARFIELENKKNALHRLADDFCDAHHLFSILPRSGRDQYLKYCPLCMEEDREIYGEAYWHRKHQIRNMAVCTKHKCRLKNSRVTARSSQTFTLEPAEIVLEAREPDGDVDVLEMEFASYIEEIFETPVDFEGNVPVKAILHSWMENTKYLKSTGRVRNIQLFTDDMQDYFKQICLGDMASIYQIQRSLSGQRTDFSTVTQIAFFLGIPVQGLLHPDLSIEQIQKSQEAKCPKEDTPENWSSYDEEMLPVLEKTAKGIYQGKLNDMGRPEKVTERLLCKHVGISPHRLENMPKCREVLEEYKESYEESWARKLAWAYEKLKVEKAGHVYWSDVREISGVKKEKLHKVLPYLDKYTEKEIKEEITALLGDGN